MAIAAGVWWTQTATPPEGNGDTPPFLAEDTLSKEGVEVDATGHFEFPGNWDEITSADIAMFYPAQTSWQWLVSEDHVGAGGTIEGSSCQTCHQEDDLGQALVTHDTLEPDPIDGKEAVITAEIKGAYDDEYIYLYANWPSEEPGITHTLWRFDGTEWQSYGGPKPDVFANNVPPSYEDRFTLLLSDIDVPASDEIEDGFAAHGCFITCHDSMREMPAEPSPEDVAAHPYFGTEGLDRKDIRKYLLITRETEDEDAAWDEVKPQDELEQLMAQGMFLDLWQARGSRSLPIGYASDDFVFEYRHTDAGTSPFTVPGTPEYMYDEDEVNFTAIPEVDFRDYIDRFHLILGETAQEIPEDAEFNEGDLLPRPVLRAPEGSGADVLANASYKDGHWTLEMRRRLDTGNMDDKTLEDGEVYYIAFGLFDDNVSNRRHHVSFVKTLGLGVDADITADRLE